MLFSGKGRRQERASGTCLVGSWKNAEPDAGTPHACAEAGMIVEPEAALKWRMDCTDRLESTCANVGCV